MTNRTKFIRDIFYNGKNKTWSEYAEEYSFRDDKQASDYWRWFIGNGKQEGYWEPSSIIEAKDIVEEIVEEIEEEIIEQENYFKPQDQIVKSREFQEFLAWKKEKSEARDFIPGTYVLLGCTHVPFHNKDFFNSILNLCSDKSPTGLVLAGDFMDMNSVSAHEVGKKPIEGVTLGWEYEEGNLALDMLDRSSNWEIKHFIYGNHEDRFWRHVSKIDTSKYGNALINPTLALKLNERGYHVQEDWKKATVYLGKHLEVIHGENCSIHAAKKTMDIFRTSVAFFHTHRFGMYMEGDTSAWNLGWGGDINHPAFSYATKAMKASWKNGAGIVIIDENGGYHMTPIIWHNNRIYYGGKKY